MKEEEIRSKLLLPFLNDLGFDISEISLETSFSIRLGKSNHIVKGRSDILCKKNGKNLFILELKNDSISITQNDIDQGISYARLLPGNIAPFTIVSNGKNTRIFDSISREELTGTAIGKQSTYWQNECTLSTDIDLQIRYEALLRFVSFSPENLKQFCKRQVEDRMGPIIGNIDNPYAKFIKELHVQRQGLQQSFDDFLDSECSVFGIVGAAGVGKTSAICSLALQKLNDHFVFFYNAAIIRKSPLEHIAQDLNGFFSSKSDSDVVLKKLDDLGKFINKDVIIFIDAVDESIDSTLGIELSEIALAARNLQRIKICISCKSIIWDSILKKSSNPTHLYEELSRFHRAIPSVNNTPGFLLEDFNNDELQTIIPLYKSIFGFKGDISESISNALRNGFFLRIFSEVYAQKEIPHEINDKELIRRYLQQSLEKTNTGTELSFRILSRIGKILIQHKFSAREAFDDPGLEIEHLVEKLELPLGDTIPEDLFARNILVKSNKEDSYNISFYYSKIRDYIICFHSYKLEKLSDSEFYDLLEQFFENHIGQSALSFYIENASSNHQQTLVRFKKDKALQYVTTYDAYLEMHFKSFKEKFNPQTVGDIGIFLPKNVLQNDGFALFQLEPNATSKVQFEDFGDVFSRSFDDSLFAKKGVCVVHGSNKGILVADQDKVVRKEVFKQLREIIQKGKISVYTSEVLLLEELSTIIYYYSKKLGYNLELKDYCLPRFDQIYPINLQDLRDKIYRFRVTEYHQRLDIDPQLKPQKIEEAIQANADTPRLRITGDFPPFEELYTIVELLLRKGIKELAEHHLPCPDVSLSEVKAFQGNGHWEMAKVRITQFTEEQARQYIETFLKHFDSCYKDFIESSFPTFKDRLPFFSTLPHEYFVYMKDSSSLQWGYLGYRHSESGEVIVHHKHLMSHEDIFSQKESNVLHTFSLDQILHVNYNDRVKTIDHFNTARVDEFCVLRNWVYNFLKNDMRVLFKENDEYI